MIGLDTNILVYAFDSRSMHHEEGIALLHRLAEGTGPFALFWPSLHEFLRVVTHPRVFSPPADTREALAWLEVLLQSPSAMLATETPRHREVLERVLLESDVRGNLVYDARLVALALQHGVDEILTVDGDFARFPQIRWRNPFRGGRGPLRTRQRQAPVRRRTTARR
ncbi:MAG: PIN domain-containing protein [Planctomycetes bacterium]|nr:PIN domain-containing protein [Planctomycetota bacterium]